MFSLYFLFSITVKFKNDLAYCLYPERPRTLGCCFVCERLWVRFPAEAAPICTVQLSGVQEILSWKERGVAARQLDRPSLTLLSVAYFVRLHIGVAICTTSVALLQVVDN